MKTMKVGNVFVNLEIIEIPPPIDGRYIVRVRCVCGAVKNISQTAWKKYKSCGCQHYTRGHHMTGTAVYRAWQSMLGRCNCPSNQAYTDYGARGIKVCRRWRKFENFLADVGDKPTSSHRFDRRRVNGNYTPSNCGWVDVQESNLNRRVALKLLWKGEIHYLKDVAALYDVYYSKARQRHHAGWSVERITGDYS